MIIKKMLFHKISTSYIYKIAIVCILLVTIPFLTAMLIAGRRISDYINETVQSRANQTVKYLNVTLDQYFNNIKKLAVLPLYNNDVISVLKNHSNESKNTYISFNEQRKISSFLSGIDYQIDTIQETKIYLRDGYCINSGGSISKLEDNDKEWMGICKKNLQYNTYIIPWDNSVAVVHALREPMTNNDIGFIKIDLKSSAINDIITAVSLPEGSKIFIYNEFSQCIYPNNISEAELEEAENPTSSFLTSYMSSNSTNFQVEALVSLDTMNNELMQLVRFAIGIIIIALIASWITSILASFRLAKPIINLKKKMALFGEGNFDTRAKVYSDDEIGQLATIFNNMTKNIETLIKEVYETQIASREAKISALQSQINPHFLYNTLETINMMAITDENYMISEAISNLGLMMRYCVSNEEHFTKLENELKFVTSYYELQKLRFEHLHSLKIYVDSKCKNQTIPKLLLQPFVENIVQHGLNDSDVDIVLATRLDEENLYITVQDNGEPMSKETREHIRQELSDPDNCIMRYTAKDDKNESKGYGVINVHRRIQLMYGNDFGVYLDESYTDGVKFILKVKCQK